MISAYGQHDATALGSLYASDPKLVFPGTTFNGRAEITGMCRRWFSAFHDVASETHRLFTSDGSFALEWTERGTNSREFALAGLRLPPTRLAAGMDGCQSVRGCRRTHRPRPLLHRPDTSDEHSPRSVTAECTVLMVGGDGSPTPLTDTLRLIV
jgi:hypothetical protein